MKFSTRLIFILVFGFQFYVFSQIPNAGFENWTNGDPDGWTTLDFFTFNTVIQSSDAHSGSSAKLEIINVGGGAYPPYLTTAFPISGRPGSLTGYYKFFPQTVNNSFDVSISLYSSTSGFVGFGYYESYNSVSSYSQFIVPIDYGIEENPDSAIITIIVTDTSSNDTPGIGSYLLVDDLAFGGATGIQLVNQNPSTFSLLQNYPNPFNPSTRINFSVAEKAYVDITVYDILGNEITKLVSGNYSIGEHSVNFDAENLPGGVYFARLSAGKYSKSIKMTLLK